MLAVAGLGVVAGSLAGLVATLGLIKAAFVAAGGAVTVFGGGLVAIKVALLAIPWVAAAAGLALLVAETVKYVNRQKEMNMLLNASTTMSNDLSGAQTKLKSKIEETKNEIEKANQKLENQIGKGKRGAAQADVYRQKIAELETQLKQLEGEYSVIVKIKTIREKFGIDPNEGGAGTRGRQGSINAKKKAAAEKAAEEAAAKAAAEAAAAAAIVVAAD